MKIVFITSECVPFASTGGLGEVCGALPVAQAALGHEVTLIMPFYRSVHEGNQKISETLIQSSLPLGVRSTPVTYKLAVRNGIRVYFVERDEFFDRRNLYGLDRRDYEDNFERFVFFQKAAVDLLDHLQIQADIVHSHDWQTGLVPLFIRHGIHGTGRPSKEKTVFTIHNLAYQGIFPASQFSHTNLPHSCFSIDGVEFYGQISCLKAGIVSADQVTTVSRTYAREIQTQERGCGLEGALSSRSNRLVGIVNGVDYREWNPSTDQFIAKRYSVDTVEDGKAECRKDLLREFGLKDLEGVPVMGIVSRLVETKGIDLIAAIMPKLMKKKAILVLLGSGSEKYHSLCEQWVKRWPEQCRCMFGYHPALAHKIYAGSQIFLMPSKVEPCGLSQLYAMRYGTVPIVHATGGLMDTVEDINESDHSGTGFTFDEYHSRDFFKAIQRALKAYQSSRNWRMIVQRIMEQNFSWHKSATEYIEVYRSLCEQETIRDLI